MKAVKYFGLAVGLTIMVGAGYLGYFLKQVAPLASGFAAHAFCSNLFIAKCQFEDIARMGYRKVSRRATRRPTDTKSDIRN